MSWERLDATAGKHAFISYVTEDEERASRLQATLEAAGVKVWRDKTNLAPGTDWAMEIRKAIVRGSLAFIVCFSHASTSRHRSHQYEELTLAIDEFRKLPPNKQWLFPVRFEPVPMPEYSLGASRTLNSLHSTDLFGPRRDVNLVKLTTAVARLVATRPEATPHGITKSDIYAMVSYEDGVTHGVGERALVPLDSARTITETSPSNPVWVGLPARPYRNVVRNELVTALGKTYEGITRHALVGQAGMGKTHAALTYAYASSRTGVTTILWIEASDSAASLAHVAREVGWASGWETPAELASLVQRWLASRPGQWLLVLNGLEPGDAIAEQVPPVLCRADGRGHVIVTTTDRGVARAYSDAASIEVGALTSRQSQTLLADAAAAYDLEVDFPAQVTELLGRSPLVLSLVADLLEGGALSPGKGAIDELRRQFRGNESAAQKLDALVDRTLTHVTPTALAALQTLSIASPTGLPFRYVVPKDRHANSRALQGVLLASGFVQIVADSSSDEDVTLAVHRLYSEKIIGRSSRRSLSFAVNTLTGNFSTALSECRHELDPFRRWKIAAEAARHLLSVSQLSGKSLVREKGFVTVALEAARQLARDSFDLQGATRVISSLRLVPHLTEDELLNLEDVELELDRLARPNNDLIYRYESLIQRQELVLPFESVLGTKRRLAELRCDKGQTKKAQMELTALLTSCQDSFGEGAPETLTTLHGLAYAYGMAGAWDQAEALLKDCLKHRIRVLGHGHPDTVTARYNLGFSMLRQDRPADAIVELEHVVRFRKKQFSPDSPLVLITRGTLANCIGELGNPENAAAKFEELVRHFSLVLGSSHELTLRTKYYHLLWCSQLGGNGLRTLIQEFESDLDRVLGGDHPLLEQARTLRGSLE